MPFPPKHVLVAVVVMQQFQHFVYFNASPHIQSSL
jgi:hypothetical protein